jgi:hypothetical protein
LKAKPGELTTIPVDIGGKTVNIPFATSGEFGIVGGEKISYAKEGLKLNEPFFIYGKGTGEESFLFMRMPKETQELSAPRYDFLKILDAKISYEKVFEQAMGGTPKTILYTEKMEKALGLSRTPKIPVLEKYTVTPLVKDIPPLTLPLYLHPPKTPAVEDIRPKVELRIEPKIPVMEEFKPDVKPSAEYRQVQVQPIVPKIGDITAVAPRIEEAAQPRVEPRVEPKISDVTVPKIAPKLEPKIDVPPVNVSDYHPPPQLPKLPPMPPLGFGGTRDVPVPRELRMFGRKEWLVSWFGPGAPMPLSTRNMKTGKARRGGRRK